MSSRLTPQDFVRPQSPGNFVPLWHAVHVANKVISRLEERISELEKEIEAIKKSNTPDQSAPQKSE